MSKEQEMREHLKGWNPDEATPYCRNCRRAVVVKIDFDSGEPMVICEVGHQMQKGKAFASKSSWFRMMRPKFPTAFKAAVNCPDYVRAEA